MTRSVGVAELKAHLSAFLRRVKRGESVTVMERDTAVARIVPIDASGTAIRIRRGRGTFGELSVPPPLRTRADIVTLLLEERGER